MSRKKQIFSVTSDSALLRNSPEFTFALSSEQQSFLPKKHTYTSIDDFFSKKILHIPKICSKFAGDLGASNEPVTICDQL